jgi:hypothetical protein
MAHPEDACRGFLMEGDDPTGRTARVTAHIAPGILGEVVVGFGSRTEAAPARGESFEVGETVVVVTVTAGKHVLVSAFS